ncbi:Uncharacterised protein [BD1-7 clade bacterium]|uniref:Lipid A deacylase LpxR family protein n=1 Tax=BD1-7 clade bacterium TaxID=2029982 RepID=A0A5S9QT39_9GAMM|nr:Uncharacterised protein [BD1-7 clade bacterium]CAA0122678.1 Uncharacterised protein [BD1-7 clade bacterium]
MNTKRYIRLLTATTITAASGISIPIAAEQFTPVDDTRWSVFVDNDSIAPDNHDRDYSFGFAFSLSSTSKNTLWGTFDIPLTAVDNAFALHLLNTKVIDYALEFGVIGFTPSDTKTSQPITDDRPYASLLYLTSSHTLLPSSQNDALTSSLTFGLLGIPIVGDIQNAIHTVASGEAIKGWRNQISAGGEPTVRYKLSWQKLLISESGVFDLKSGFQGSIGYLTEASWDLTLRAGQLRSQWWSFAPEAVDYGYKHGSISKSTEPEGFVWAGISIKARAYNAFLQGQFRDSEVSYDFNEIRHFIVESWLGYTHVFDDNFQFSYALRYESAELKTSRGDRSQLWGGLVFSHTFE